MTAEEKKRRKEVILSLMTDPLYRPMRAREIAVFLDVPKERREDLQEVLDELAKEGRIRVSGRGKYMRPEKHRIAGVFHANAKGFGFVSIEGSEQDIFIPRESTHGAMDGDTVRISVEPGQQFRRAEGAVREVLKRANPTVVGYYRRVQNFGLVMPDNQRLYDDIYVAPGKAAGAVTGHKVVVRITRFPRNQEEEPEGEVEEILGHVSEPGVDILSISRAFGLPDTFPQEAMQEAESLRNTDFSDLAGRRDYRDLPTVTIDGEDAKDFDDAVTLKELPDGGAELYVHIADVSWFVREGSALDKEAYRRGTSVYLADRVLPMLPQVLSNDLCSLRPGKDRFTLTCRMTLDKDGRVTDHELVPSVIRSDRRLTYTEVNRLLTGADSGVPAGEAAQAAAAGAGSAAGAETGIPADIAEMLFAMDRFAKKLRAHREARGALDFDFPESRVILDEKGKPVGIEKRERNAATMLIEDFMIAANEAVAESYAYRKLPFLFRVHDRPDPEKMREFAAFVSRFGCTLKNRRGEIHPRELQKLLREAQDREEAGLILRIALRSMKKAEYLDALAPHFGLASSAYTHFTSPIRRYPDLQIHRIIREDLAGGLDDRRIGRYEASLGETAAWCSRTERRAEEAERDCLRYKMCEYMESHTGEVYDGIVSGVTRYGLFVTLPNSVEGMIRIQDLRDDYYEFNEHEWALEGEVVGKRITMGESMRVKVVRADRLSRTVDLEPA